LIIDVFGWKKCALFGVGLQIIIICCLPKIFEWINQGVVEIDSSISDEEELYNEYPPKTLPGVDYSESEEASFEEEEI
jgi:hypothetical protein